VCLGEGVEADAAKEVEDNAAKDTVMCGTLTTHTEHTHHENWVPPPVEQEFSYPSDEEIMPNPKASFSKDFLKLGKVRGWFKGSEKGDGEKPSSSAAPCLPITDGRLSPSKDPQYSRPYVLLSSRLPQDPVLLQQYLERQGMATRLRSIASERAENGSTHSQEGHESDDSDRDSSSSLQRLSDSPRYSDLAHSMMSEEECELEDENIYCTSSCDF
jgi:hypothetical protein